MPPRKSTDSALLELRRFGLSYPEAHLKSPWPEHADLAVRDKTFAHMSVEGQPFSISCKLPESGTLALELPFASPTGYGLGKSGWVTAKFSPGQAVPLDLLKDWIDESYRARAPKKLSAAAPRRDAVTKQLQKKVAPRKESKAAKRRA